MLKYFGIFYYITVLLCLPFQSTFVVFSVGLNIATLSNTILAFMTLGILFQLKSYIIVSSLAYILGIYASYLNNADFAAVFNSEYWNYYVGFMIFISLLSIVLSKAKEKRQKRFVESAKTMTGVVAHELSIPIAMLSNESKLFKTSLQVIKRYHKLFPKDDIPPAEFKLLKEAKQTIESKKNKLDYADKVLEIMLNNAKNRKIFTEDASKCSIADCVKEALDSYPYKNLDLQKKLISFKIDKNFEFLGSQSLIVHVLHNLLKNSFKAIKLAGKGEISIYTKSKWGLSCLVVEDTALGMEKHQISNVTEQFVAYWNDSTGLGLPFCKEVMSSIGGYLEIAAEHSKFTRVSLSFPKITKKSLKKHKSISDKIYISKE